MLHYEVAVPNPATHEVEVTLRFAADRDGEVVLLLPVWIPGSYLVREFARHLVSVAATRLLADGREVPLWVHKSAKQRWIVKGVRRGEMVVVRCRFWAYDRSVREALLSDERALLNGTSLFMVPEDRLGEPCTLTLVPPAEAGWQVATTLPAHVVDGQGFGQYQARDYHALVDAPITMGKIERLAFAVAGVPHEVVVTGATIDWDRQRLIDDLQKLCGAYARFFGTLPFARYCFHLHLTDQDYGGLEHRESSLLLSSRTDLPSLGMKTASDAYTRLLGLFSHEYLHAWVVKRLRPRSFLIYDYFHEQPTRLLWLFEGWVAYYDDLMLCRAGLIDPERYLGLLSDQLTRVVSDPGHRVQPLADASLDAWIKFYRPHPHSASLFTNYYTKGAVVACALDWRLRLRGSSLDELLLTLWRSYGEAEVGVTEDEIFAAVASLGGRTLCRWLQTQINEAHAEPLTALAPSMGVAVRYEYHPYPDLGVRWESGRNPLVIAQVLSGSPAEAAGLAAGDEVVAFNRLRVTPSNCNELLARYAPGEMLAVGLFREGVWQERTVQLAPATIKRVVLSAKAQRGQPARRLAAWLGRGEGKC